MSPCVLLRYAPETPHCAHNVVVSERAVTRCKVYLLCDKSYPILLRLALLNLEYED